VVESLVEELCPQAVAFFSKFVEPLLAVAAVVNIST
jgi:hypothetical protein